VLIVIEGREKSTIPRNTESNRLEKNSEIPLNFDANVLIFPIIPLLKAFPGFSQTPPSYHTSKKPLLPPSFRPSIDRAGKRNKVQHIRLCNPSYASSNAILPHSHSIFFTSSTILDSETYSGPPKIHQFPLASCLVGQCVLPWTSGGGIAGLSFKMRKSCKICFFPAGDF